MKVSVDRIREYLDERNYRKAEAHCMRAYEMFQENGIEIYDYTIERHAEPTSWQLLTGNVLHVVRIEIFSEKRYTVHTMCNRNTEERWAFIDGNNNAKYRTLEQIVKEIRRPCKKFSKRMYHEKKKYLKMTNMPQYVETYMS